MKNDALCAEKHFIKDQTEQNIAEDVPKSFAAENKGSVCEKPVKMCAFRNAEPFINQRVQRVNLNKLDVGS